MKRILSFLGMTVGGWLGWMAGEQFSFFAAYIGAVVGTAVGLFMIRKWTADLP